MEKVSFNFSKKKDTKLLQDSKLRDESTKDEEDDKDFVTAVQGNEIQGTKKKIVKKELVIPLIGKNEWRKPTTIPSGESPEQTKDEEGDVHSDNGRNPSQQLSLEDQAIQELLLGSAKNGQNQDPDSIPLLLQNKVPDGYEEDDNMDVSLRPDQSTLDDYEKIPIEEFGMAMLRGMGWKKTEGIGLKNKQHVEMLEPQLRPKGLGLGASASQIKNDVQNGHSNNNKKEEEVLVFKIGAGALVERGPDKSMYGRIEAFDEDNNRVILKLAISGKMAGVSKFHISLVKESDYKTKSKVLNYDQYAEYKKKQDSKDQDRRDRSDADNRLREDESNRDRKRGTNERDSKPHHSSTHKHKASKHNSEKSKSNESSSRKYWVRPNLKVRFIDQKYKNGKYYEKKFVIEDAVELDNFVLRSESGNTLIENICTSQLETVIPKEPQTPICILFGKQKGQVGELIERNRKKETAIVKIPDGGVYELSYDDICEFVGDPEEFY